MTQNIPWFAPAFGAAEKDAVLNVIDSNYINEGGVTRTFERKVADLVGVEHCVAVTSGTMAISLALMGLGVGPGDEVIVPDLTFIATANAVRLTGAEVKLVDVEPVRFSMDPAKAAAAVGPRTKAIVPVDVNGRGADYDALQAICLERDLRMVCDSAEALGSRYAGKHLGSFGNAGCFSFSAAKTVSTGQGGMIATSNTDLYHRLLELKDQGRRTRGTGGNDLHPVMGYNFKFTNLQAAVGLAQLERLAERLDKARERDQWYREGLHNCPGVNVAGLDGDDGEIRQWAEVLVKDRPQVEDALTQAGIGFRPFWFPLHTQAPYRQSDDGFRNAIDISAEGLWLPSHFDLTQEQANRVCAVIRGAVEA